MNQTTSESFLHFWTIAKIVVCLIVFVTIWPILPVSYMFTIVTSGSMEPNILKGDLLLSLPSWRMVDIGDVVIVKIPLLDTPICHRVVAVDSDPRKYTVKIMTKGDANLNDDRWMLPKGQIWIPSDNIKGKVVLRIPFLGLLVRKLTQSYIGMGFVLLLWTLLLAR